MPEDRDVVLAKIHSLLPDPDFVPGMDHATFAEFVSRVRDIVVNSGLKPEDLRSLSPHPGSIVVQWVRKRMVPRSADVVDPGMYFKALSAIFRAADPFLLPEHRVEFRKAVADHVAAHIIDDDPDPQWFKSVRAQLQRHGIADIEYFDAQVFQRHRDLVVHQYLAGDIPAAARHARFVYASFGNRAHTLDKKYSYVVGGRSVSPLKETARRISRSSLCPPDALRVIKKYV
ncbi:MAG: hypothetical protein GXN93_01615 [Candidatus Diapherotrites archaeon]|nr:hypothetical protein [Candidatus Diapherotrites archaeon]